MSSGQTRQLTATPRDASGIPLTGRTITWASDNVSVAQVNATGVVTSLAVGGPVTITATSEGTSGSAAVTVTSFAGPLRVSLVNPRYFTDGTGRAIYLTGAHTWMNREDAGFSDPPPPFNWHAYLASLQLHHHNFTRLWHWEQAKWSAETPNDLWFDPMPYQRPGPGTALDGKPKFDLTRFNPAYFARLRERVVAAGQRGIYVSIMLFNGWSIEEQTRRIRNPWPGHPFNRANNVNGIDGDSNKDGRGLETHTLQIPAVTALQEAYVRKVVDAVNDLDNVLYEISNESRAGTGAEAWEEHMIQYVKRYEAGKPKQHPVGMTALWPAGKNVDLFASSADWISPNGKTTDPLAADGSKVILEDTDHLCGLCGDQAWVWKSFTRGLNPLFMDPYDGAWPDDWVASMVNDPRWEQIRTNLGYTLTYAARLNLVAMRPHGELASTGYCLANPVSQGAEYLVYLPSGGEVAVDLRATPGMLTVEWFSPSTGQTTVGGPRSGGAVRTLTAPSGGDAVLYLH
jgi:hypothetical protein